MTLKEQINFIRSRKPSILLISLIFGVFGVIAYFLLPVRYVAVGSLFITRQIENIQPIQETPSQENFTYEGYYAQQNALSFTSTIAGLIESDDVKSALLQKMNMPVNASTLRKVGRSIRVNKKAPQLVEVSIKASDPDLAEEQWLLLTDTVVSLSSNLSQQGDPNIGVIKVSEVPIIKETYRNPYVNFLVGFGLGGLFTILGLAFKEYMQGYVSSGQKKQRHS